jgi:hypothetical protein
MTVFSKPALLLLAACLAFAGCTQVVVPEKLANNLRSIQTELALGRSEVVKTTDAMRNLRENKGNDVKPQYATFTQRLTDLESKVGGMQIVGSISREKAAVFFKDWETQISQIQDENVARSTEDRRKQTMDAYTDLRNKIQALRDAYTPYYSSLNDVRNGMAVDTTQQGANAVRPAMDKAINGEKDVLDRLDDVNKTISWMIGS